MPMNYGLTLEKWKRFSLRNLSYTKHGFLLGKGSRTALCGSDKFINSEPDNGRCNDTFLFSTISPKQNIRFDKHTTTDPYLFFDTKFFDIQPINYEKDTSNSVFSVASIVVPEVIIEDETVLSKGDVKYSFKSINNDSMSYSEEIETSLEYTNHVVGSYSSEQYGKVMSLYDGKHLISSEYTEDNKGKVLLYEESTLLNIFSESSTKYYGLAISLNDKWYGISSQQVYDVDDIQGEVFLYNNLFTLCERISPPAGAESLTFGCSISIYENKLAIGDKLQGKVYIYDLENFTNIDEIVLETNVEGEYFGSSVQLFGDILIVSAEYNSEEYYRSGKVYVYERTLLNDWKLIQTIVPPVAQYKLFFGNAISVYDNYLVIGAKGYKEGESLYGTAYLYRTSGQGFDYLKTLISSDRNINESYGSSVSIHKDKILVGDEYGNRCSIFEFNNLDSFEETAIVYRDTSLDVGFGSVVCVYDDVLLISSPKSDNGKGSFNIVDLTTNYFFNKSLRGTVCLESDYNKFHIGYDSKYYKNNKEIINSDICSEEIVFKAHQMKFKNGTLNTNQINMITSDSTDNELTLKTLEGRNGITVELSDDGEHILIGFDETLVEKLCDV